MNASPSILGYCTNVHAGTTLDSVLDNLRAYAVPVRQRLQCEQLGIGLWFSEAAAREALQPGAMDRLRGELRSMGLVPYTLNGFPQGDFHTSVVKHRVYQPTWWEASRAEYTRDLIQILDRLLEPGQGGSISTLPIAWGEPTPSVEQCTAASRQLLDIANELHRLHETTGRTIVLALEPEPGCCFTDSQSLRAFFDRYLSAPAIPSALAETARRYLTVCHDVCHAAVMCEDQTAEIVACHRQGIRIGKVQVSSAISVPWDRLTSEERVAARAQLAEFAEDRYLHQTMVRESDGTKRLHEDLPDVLRDRSLERGEWRIHFHVPIYIDRWGALQSTRSEIDRLIALWHRQPDMLTPQTHIEVETYAWGVLPAALRVQSLDQGIAKELEWLRSRWESFDATNSQPQG